MRGMWTMSVPMLRARGNGRGFILSGFGALVGGGISRRNW